VTFLHIYLVSTSARSQYSCPTGQCWYCSQCTGCCTCAAGYYCPGDDQQYPCPANYYSSTQGTSSLATCKACPSGQVSLSGSTICSPSISVFAGTLGVSGYSGNYGDASSATFTLPSNTAIDKLGNVYVVDKNNHVIRKVSKDGTIMPAVGTGSATCCGDGSYATSAYLYYPSDIALDVSGNMYIADTYNHRIRYVSYSTSIISTKVNTYGGGSFSGDGGNALYAYLLYPAGVAVDSSLNIYIADTGNHRLRKVTASTGYINTIAGAGAYYYPYSNSPYFTAGYYLNPLGWYYFNYQYYYTAYYSCWQSCYTCYDYNYCPNSCCYFSCLSSCVSGYYCYYGGYSTSSTYYCPNSGGYYSYNYPTYSNTYGGYNQDNVAGTNSFLNSPNGVAVDASGNVYIADTNNYRIRKVAANTGIITTVVGTGSSGSSADGLAGNSNNIGAVYKVSLDQSGNLYYGDNNVYKVKALSTSTQKVSTVAGTGVYSGASTSGPLTVARFAPYGVNFGRDGNIYISDQSYYVVWKIQGTETERERVSNIIPQILHSTLCTDHSIYMAVTSMMASYAYFLTFLFFID
jgi:trimeric autotransporter adhesin